MTMNKIQFQAGLSLDEFNELYGNEEQCELVVEKSRWPDGYECCKCHCNEHYVVRHGKVKTFQCRTCHHQETLTGGTIFHSTKLPLTKWFQAMHLLTQSKNNVAALELKRFLGVCYRTAWRLKQKILVVMTEREADRQLEGRIVVDDVYLGGELHGGTAGRGSENKIPFIAAIQTDKGNFPIYAVFSRVKTFSIDEVESWAKKHICAASIVVSDGLACFSGVTAAGAVHAPIVVGKNRKSIDMPCFNWINTIIGNLKTAESGTYHAFKFGKYGFRYLAEAQYRFNRRFNMKEILPRLLRAAATTGKRTEAWIRLAEDQR